ncbi:hypothetical protein MUN46_010750 [Mesosutterella sp. AGMB02718]|uniref:Uncharacterized protein n=1 Tax=Mesosutterella faecium TaxID=2925194 RepID=A0ABT7IPW3_9BURK|nr:hypothetical protein [Mesosutterella sp. AGMB02718]MDL2060414.1 hypothetical protein [Mesosutterella sp. AGMB02718]
MKNTALALCASLLLALSATAQAASVGDMIERVLNWGRTTLGPKSVQTEPNPFSARSFINLKDDSIEISHAQKTFHTELIKQAKATESLYANNPSFEKFYRLYLNNIVSFNNKVASRYKEKQIFDGSVAGRAIEQELAFNGFSRASRENEIPDFELTPNYGFFRLLPSLPRGWAAYFALMDEAAGKIPSVNSKKEGPAPQRLGRFLLGSDAFLKAYPNFPYAYEIRQLYAAALTYFTHDPEIARSGAKREHYLEAYADFLKEGPETLAAPFVRQAASRVKSRDYVYSASERIEIATALGLSARCQLVR